MTFYYRTARYSNRRAVITAVAVAAAVGQDNTENRMELIQSNVCGGERRKNEIRGNGSNSNGKKCSSSKLQTAVWVCRANIFRGTVTEEKQQKQQQQQCDTRARGKIWWQMTARLSLHTLVTSITVGWYTTTTTEQQLFGDGTRSEGKRVSEQGRR